MGALGQDLEHGADDLVEGLATAAVDVGAVGEDDGVDAVQERSEGLGIGRVGGEDLGAVGQGAAGAGGVAGLGTDRDAVTQRLGDDEAADLAGGSDDGDGGHASSDAGLVP